jgi:pimeloyl-ACP methyl ester carboxylesterase
MALVSNGNVTIHYEVAGEGEPLVLQHGFFGSIQDWYEYGYVEALKRRFQLLLIDARGHGASAKPHQPEEYSLYLRALDVVKVLDAQKIEKCHYLGYSMGGWIGFGLMQWFPARFRSFVLSAIQPYAMETLGMREAVATLERWVPQLPISEARKERFLSNDREALLAAVAENRTDNAEALRNLTVPCLLMAGDRDAIYQAVRQSSRLSGRIELVTIPGADHNATLSRSDRVIPELERFLKGI